MRRGGVEAQVTASGGDSAQSGPAVEPSPAVRDAGVVYPSIAQPFCPGLEVFLRRHEKAEVIEPGSERRELVSCART